MGKIGAAVLRELRAILPALVFFLFLFHLIALTRAVTVRDFSFTALRATVATVGALIVAKSILVVERLPVARFFSERLVINAFWKAVLFGVVALLFRLIEEIVPLVVKHQDFLTAVARLSDEVPWPTFWVLQLWLFAALFLYSLVVEVARVAGAGKVRATLLGPTSFRAREP